MITNAVKTTRELDGWYPDQKTGSYYILVYEVDYPRILIDEFIKDGFTTDTTGDAFEHFVELAQLDVLEGRDWDD